MKNANANSVADDAVTFFEVGLILLFFLPSLRELTHPRAVTGLSARKDNPTFPLGSYAFFEEGDERSSTR